MIVRNGLVQELQALQTEVLRMRDFDVEISPEQILTLISKLIDLVTMHLGPK